MLELSLFSFLLKTLYTFDRDAGESLYFQSNKNILINF